MAKTKQVSPVFLSKATVDVKFQIAVDGYYHDVEGFMDIRTGEFTPEIISVFSVHQFVEEAGLDMSKFLAELQAIVTKELRSK